MCCFRRCLFLELAATAVSAGKEPGGMAGCTFTFTSHPILKNFQKARYKKGNRHAFVELNDD